ncbi:MAG TPA: PAS domain S-box protein, partial [Actinomycetota bacterium]|nr:PAS domain S-box protein [Actinomycetota bacterium]
MNGRRGPPSPRAGSLDDVVAASIRPVAAGLAALSAVFALTHAVLAPPRVRPTVLALGAALAGCFLLLHAALRRRPVGPGRGHSTAAALAGVALLGVLADLRLGPGPPEASLLLLFLVGVGALVLSWRWWAVLTSLGLAAWAASIVGAGPMPPGEVLHDGYGVLVAVVLGALVHGLRLRTIGELDRQLNLVDAILRASPQAMVATDRRGRVTMWNPAAERILGFSAREAVGRIPPHVSPEGWEAYEARRGRALAGETIVGDEVVRRRRDGTDVVLALAMGPLRGRDGSVVGTVSVLADVTERRAAEEAVRLAERRFRTLVEQLPAVAYVWDARSSVEEGAYYFTSPQIQDLLGYSPEEWDGDPELWRERIHPDDRAAVFEATERCLRTGEPFEMEYRYLAKDGRVVWVHDRAALLQRDASGRPLVFQGVMFDVTDRRAAEDVLRRSEAELRRSLEGLREDHEERRRALTLVLEAQEEELGRLAEGIEDEHLQRLAALEIRLETLRRRLDDDRHLDALAALERTVQGVAGGLRGFLAELRPRELETGGLAEAIRRAAASILPPEVSVRVEDRLVREPDE